MWVLLIVLLTVVPGINQVTVLNTFETYETCKPERDRIGFEMAEAYPGENDFVIVCEFRQEGSKRHVRLIPRERDRVLDGSPAGKLTFKRADGPTFEGA